jgi:hypothetical protein
VAGGEGCKKSLDGEAAEEAQLARELGISLRRLGGWEPAQVTTYEYAPDGALVRSITVTEPEWDGREVAQLIASRRLDLRGPHGHLLVESMSPDADPNNRGGTHYYESDFPRVDFAERARLNAADRYRAGLGENESMNGLVFPVRKVDRKPH